MLRSLAPFLAALAALLCAPAAHAQEHPEALAAQVRADVPDTDGQWPLRFLLGVPEGVEVPSDGSSPVTVLHPVTGAPLPTQAEVHLRGPDGAPRSLWIAATIPAGLEPGEAHFDVEATPTPLAGPALTPIVNAALFKGGAWTLSVEGLEGGVYQARFTKAEVVRLGSVEVVWRGSAPLLPVLPEGDAALQLPHLGVVTLDVRAWSGVDALDLRVLWEGGVVDSPLAWTLFRSAVLRAPAGADVRPLLPTAGVGDLIPLATGSLLPLAARELGPHGTLPHHAKLWALGVAPPGAWDQVEPVLAGGGWGWAESGPWSPEETTPTAAGLPIPDLAFLGREKCSGAATAALAAWRQARASGDGLEGSYGALSWRHPSGIGYGGQTGGEGIEPWPFLHLVWGDPAASFAYLTGRMENRLDRTRISLAQLDGEPWDVDAAKGPWNFTISAEPLWGESWVNNWPSYSQDPLGFRGAREVYREATAELADKVLAGDRGYGNDDVQHFTRGRRGLWPLVEYYAEPMAELVLEHQSVALRADWWDGAPATEFTGTMAWLAEQIGSGVDYGRDFAWAGHHVALAYAAGSDDERAKLSRWAALWCTAFMAAPTETGLFQVMQGKEVAFAKQAAVDSLGHATDLRPTQTYQLALVAWAGLQMRGAFAEEGLATAMDDEARRSAQWVSELAWGAEATLPDYRFASVVLDDQGAVHELVDRAEVEATYASTLHWPDANDDGNRVQLLHVSLIIAAGVRAGAEGVFVDAASRFLGAGPDQWLAAARNAAWSSTANWLPLVAALEGQQ